MRVLVACDKFKETLSGIQVNRTIAETLRKTLASGDITTREICLSDGGEGWLETLARPLQLEIHSVTVTGPYPAMQVSAQFGYHPLSRLAVIEMASACGLDLVPPHERHPLGATTKGLGTVIREAINLGAKQVLLGIGGSATNDGGLGALQELGVIVNRRNQLTGATETAGPVCGMDLLHVSSLQVPGVDSPASPARIREALLGADVSLKVACDVRNPFVGPDGATSVFSEQKGATPDDKRILEAGMANLAQRFRELTGVDVASMSGAGAAGGVGGGFAGVLGADLRRGIELLGGVLGLEEAIVASDVVVTGEGCFDAQTFSGKVVSQVHELCERHAKPMVVVCGLNRVPKERQYCPVYDTVSLFSRERSMQHAQECLEGLVAHYAKEIVSLASQGER